MSRALEVLKEQLEHHEARIKKQEERLETVKARLREAEQSVKYNKGRVGETEAKLEVMQKDADELQAAIDQLEGPKYNLEHPVFGFDLYKAGSIKFGRIIDISPDMANIFGKGRAGE